MSYNQEFFEKYKNYLKETKVRHVHNHMFMIYKSLLPILNIVDFGCGQCCEFIYRCGCNNYFGFDFNPPDSKMTYACDYTKISKEDILKKVTFPINGFVSLFSTECCLSVEQKYHFYRKIFQEHDIKVALVSGFYYKDKIKDEQVTETNGILSYQSIEDQKFYKCDEFIELRTYIDVPSELFGVQVVEVWKFLIKNGN